MENAFPFTSLLKICLCTSLGRLAVNIFLSVQDVSVYLGAAPIVECLERYKPNVIITSRVADASLFLGPMV